MEKYLNKILIVDGSYLLHRSLRTPGLQELETVDGLKSGGIYGSLRILQSELKKFPQYFPIFCFDKGLSSRRTELYPDYKANRHRLSADSLMAVGEKSKEDEYLEEYHRQRADLIQILKYLGIPSLLIPGWEGDDLQYLLSIVCKDGVVLSDDKDMIQLVSPTIKIRRSLRDELITWEDSPFEYRHPFYTIAKSITGDPSDNIKKVAEGVGGKGAVSVAELMKDGNSLEEYHSLLESSIPTLKGALQKKADAVLKNWNQFEINYKLTDLRLVNPPEGFEDMLKDLIRGVVGHPNVLKAYSLLGKYSMNSIYPDQIIASVSASSSVLFY